jgi:hypothetical protein
LLIVTLEWRRYRRSGMSKSRTYAVEIAAQVALALAVGLAVSIVLGGAALLLAEGAASANAAPRALGITAAILA